LLAAKGAVATVETSSYKGEVVLAMDKKKELVKVQPESKFVIDVDKNIDTNDMTP
jgi:26S proteasome regulatory subunit T6